MKNNRQEILSDIPHAKSMIENDSNLSRSQKKFIDSVFDRIEEEFNQPVTVNPTRSDPHRVGRKKAAHTKIKVEFFNPTKVINCDTAQNTYIECIKEFGVERVRLQFPNWIKSTFKKGRINLAPNSYLEIGINNVEKKARIEKIANFYNRAVAVTLT